MLKDEYKVYEEKMRKSIDSVAADFAAVRAGRANAQVLDRFDVSREDFIAALRCAAAQTYDTVYAPWVAYVY